jgi:predicted nucleic acid-binding protein
VTSRLTHIEIASAILRRFSENEITAEIRDGALAQLDRDINTIHVIELSKTIARIAIDLMSRRRLRPADAVHLASALEYGRLLAVPVHFLAYDARLSEAAANEGLIL